MLKYAPWKSKKPLLVVLFLYVFTTFCTFCLLVLMSEPSSKGALPCLGINEEPKPLFDFYKASNDTFHIFFLRTCILIFMTFNFFLLLCLYKTEKRKKEICRLFLNPLVNLYVLPSTGIYCKFENQRSGTFQLTFM